MASAASLTGGGNSAKNPFVMAYINSNRFVINTLYSLLVRAYCEDGSERDFSGTDEGEDGKVSQEARCDRVTTATRRGTRSTDCDILQYIHK